MFDALAWKLLTRLINCLKTTNRYGSFSGEPNMKMFSALYTHNTKCVCNKSCVRMIYSSMFCLQASVLKWRAFTLSGKPNLNSHFVFFPFYLHSSHDEFSEFAKECTRAYRQESQVAALATPASIGLPLQGQSSYLSQLPALLILHLSHSLPPELRKGQSQLEGNRKRWDDYSIWFLIDLCGMIRIRCFIFL